MRFVFAYDVQVERKSEAEEVYHNYFDYQVWKRYLQACEELTVVTRVVDLPPGTAPKNRKLSSGPRVRFASVPTLSNPVAQWRNKKQAEAIISEQLSQADALIARLPSEIGSVAIEVAKRMGKPWAVEVVGHAWDALWNHGSWQGKVYAPIMTLRTKRLVKQAPRALYVTQSFLQKHYPSDGHTVHCSNVEVSRAPEQVLQHRIDRIQAVHDSAASMTRQTQRIGLIGSLVSQYKGVDVAIRALAQLEDKSLSLHILGEGDQMQWRQYAAKWGIGDQVHFHDPLPSGAAVWEWLDQLDLYIQPSFQEGLPRALIEAMSRALPCIGSTAGGIPELLDPKWIIPKGNSLLLAEKIKLLAHSSVLKRESAERNYKLSHQYANDVLDARRSAFWQAYADEVSRSSQLSVAKLVEG